MLSPEEEGFIEYWEKNRLKQKRIVRQFLLGTPVALLFVIPIAVNFFSGWYKRAAMMTHTTDFNPGVLLVALLLIVGFVAIFSRRLKWDRNEEHYIELRARKSREEKAEKK